MEIKIKKSLFICASSLLIIFVHHSSHYSRRRCSMKGFNEIFDLFLPSTSTSKKQLLTVKKVNDVQVHPLSLSYKFILFSLSM